MINKIFLYANKFCNITFDIHKMQN